MSKSIDVSKVQRDLWEAYSLQLPREHLEVLASLVADYDAGTVLKILAAVMVNAQGWPGE